MVFNPCLGWYFNYLCCNDSYWFPVFCRRIRLYFFWIFYYWNYAKNIMAVLSCRRRSAAYFFGILKHCVLIDSSFNGMVVYWLRYFPVFIFLQSLFKKTNPAFADRKFYITQNENYDKFFSIILLHFILLRITAVQSIPLMN